MPFFHFALRQHNGNSIENNRFSNGWYHTQDIAYKENGIFYFLGRQHDMIKTGGLKVYPNEIEEIINSHPAVKEAAVIGIPDPKRGEIIKAFIVPQNENILTRTIRKYCSENLALYKTPSVFQVTDRIPRNPNGKIDKKALQEKA
jgi:acyl-CoA synthetase (AMP-forming)/AMP-acid ligase II